MKQEESFETQGYKSFSADKRANFDIAKMLISEILSESPCDCTIKAIKSATVLMLSASAASNEDVKQDDANEMLSYAILKCEEDAKDAQESCMCGSDWIISSVMNLIFTPHVVDKKIQRHDEFISSIRNVSREVNAKRKASTKTYIVYNKLSRLIKIGKAVDVKKRILDIGNMAGTVLDEIMVFNEDIERALHKKFSSIRVHGEWFSDDGQIRSFCDEMQNKYGGK